MTENSNPETGHGELDAQVADIDSLQVDAQASQAHRDPGEAGDRIAGAALARAHAAQLEVALERERAARRAADARAASDHHDVAALRREADVLRRQAEADRLHHDLLLEEVRMASRRAGNVAEDVRHQLIEQARRADQAESVSKKAREDIEQLLEKLELAERRMVRLWQERLTKSEEGKSELDRATADADRKALRGDVAGVAGDPCADLAEGDGPHSDVDARVGEAENALVRARASRDATERMRQIAARKVSDLRQVLEAVGAERQLIEDMSTAFSSRYRAALAERDSARARDVRQIARRMLSKVSGGRPASDLDPNDVEELNWSIYMDGDWYLEQYPDVRDSGLTPTIHYLRHGAAENRDPGPWFSTETYFLNNPDVLEAKANPLLHFLRHGLKEGRSARSRPVVKLAAAEATAGRHRQSCIFITGEPESPGHRYRVTHLIEAAEANDVMANWVRADDLARRHDELASYDVAIFWRVAWTDEVGDAIAHLRAHKRVILFDVDDLMTEPDLARLDIIDGIRTQSLTEDIAHNHFDRVRRTMLEADVCLTTTEELAYYLRWAGKTTHVISNSFDRSTAELSRLEMRKWRAAKRDGLIRIGYAGGSHTHQQDFAVAVEAIAQMLRDDERCRLVLFRAPAGPLVDPREFPALNGLEDRIEWRAAVALADLPRELARFDINIAPLEIGNPFCEAKSELKFFEAALVDVPTIASPTGPFRRAIRHGKTGFLAASADDWLHHLKRLAGDPELRSTIGRAAFRAALSNFGPEMRALRFGHVLEQLKGGTAAARGFALGAQLAAREAPVPKVFPSDVIFERDKLEAAQVSVVVPLYNYQSYIEETLDSVRTQTAECLDLIIVDGFSTDNSLAVARKWAKKNAARFNRILVLQNRANYGLAYCRNSGVDAAETPYVLFLDADNKLLPDACEEMAATLNRTGAGFAYSTIRHFGASQALIGNAPFHAQRFAPGNYIDAMALVSKEAWAMIGGVDHIRHGWEDYDMWCRLSELGLRGEWIERPLALYRVHDASMQTMQTTVPENLRRLMENFKQRHPWTSLIDQERSRVAPAKQLALTPPAERTRVDMLLPMLRCPETHQKLGYNADRTALVSFDGLRTWPIRDGRPLLSNLTLDARVQPVDHVSNYLSQSAVDLINATSGPVLNLSAGGTAKRFDHVVEVEFSLFRHTDVAADAHHLPFDDGVFDAVIALNAFEHYSDPTRVAAELHRVLKPGGKILIATAFLQPLHEKPWHFYNCTRYGLEEWFRAFELDSISVTDNFSPNFTLGWIAAESENAVRGEIGDKQADAFLKTRLGDFVRAYRDPDKRQVATWDNLHKLSQPAQEVTAAGFEMIGRKPSDIPVLVK